MAQSRTHYQVLGVSRRANADEIKQAYRRLIRDTHPDRLIGQRGYVMQDPEALARLEVAIAQAEQETRLLNEAYDVLTDPDKRREYDGLTPAQWLVNAPTVPWKMDLPQQPTVYLAGLACVVVLLAMGMLLGNHALNLDGPSQAGAAAVMAEDAQQAFEDGDLALAVDFYTRALALQPQADFYYQRGLVRLAEAESGETSAAYQALSDFDAALHHNPDHTGALLQRGLLLHALWSSDDDRDRAIADLTRYLDLATDPDPAARHALNRLQESSQA